MSSFPECLQAASVLANLVWVYSPTNACFDPAVANCTMPADVASIDGMFPVNVTKPMPSFKAASATGEMWINSTGIQIPFNASTVLLGRGVNGADLGHITTAGVTVTAVEEGVEVEKLELAASNIKLEGFTVLNLSTTPGVDLDGLELVSMKTFYPLRLTASPARGVINLDNAMLDTTMVVSLICPLNHVDPQD